MTLGYGDWFLQYYPILLGGILLLTAIYNVIRHDHIKQEMEQRHLSVWLSYAAILTEIVVALLAFWGANSLAMLLATALLIGSITACVLTNWPRRLWLSIPLLFLNLLWWWISSSGL